jgi:tetratricopeptide (TPR) repeat protein
VLSGLDELWQRRIMREYDGACYDFSHDRIRDVAYAMIGPVKRRLLHRQVAKALERIYGADTDPVAEELAVHCQRADAFKQALAYFRQAAEAAKRVYAHAKVVENLQKAIKAVQMLPASPENKEIEINLWYGLGLAEILVHDWGGEQVGAAWNRARELAMQTDSVSLRGRAFLALQTIHGVKGQLRKALEFSRLALSLAQDSEDPFLMINVFGAHGGNLYHAGQPEPAIEYLAKVRRLAEHDIQPSFEWLSNHPEINAHIRLAKALWLLGQPDRAKLLCDEAIATNSVNEDLQDQFTVLDFSAMLYSFLRDEDRVLQLGEALLELSMKYDYPFYQRAGRMFVGWALAHSGDAKAGAKQVRESMNGHRDRGIRKFEPYWRSLLAETLALAGEPSEALSEVDQALAYADESGTVYWSAHLLKLKGDYLQAQSAPDQEVERWYQQAIDTAQSQRARSLELRATTSLCRLWLRQGRLSEARKALSDIYGSFTEGFDTRDLKEAKALLEELELTQ